MCGIAGFQGGFDQALLERMNAALSHRGPDDAGMFLEPEDGLGLAHRRLSIIDLSPRGHQPMWDATESVAIVYNGELYNYRELREGLLRDGFEFKSDSDTEVLLNLYRRDGPDMLEHLNGIFAFGIWDKQDKSLFLARDGVGVKPLYFAETPRGFLFASEIKALLQDAELDRTLDYETVRHHMLFLWAPAPHTMLRSVKKLQPGHGLIVRGGRIQHHWQFYDLPYQQPIEALPEKEAIEQVRHHLQQAVERQLVADVPIGAFLSGGIDSSSVVAMAQRATPDRKVQCFTIGFEGPEAQVEGMAEDLPYARRVANHLGVDLHTIFVGPEMVDELEKMVFYLDEPQADPAPINALFIAQLARQHGIKVLLSGSGGDDIFTGYRRHYALREERLWSWLPATLRRSLVRASTALKPRDEVRRRIAKALRYAGLDGDERIASYFYWIAPSQVNPLLAEHVRGELVGFSEAGPLLESLLSLPSNSDRINRMLYLEGKFFLTDHNLNYADKMAMASGVEVRVPMLDPDLVALAARLPVNYKQRGRIGKWILRKAMEQDLPRDVLYRKKAGFGAPLRHWLRNELRPIVDDVLSEESLSKRGLFDPAAVRSVVAQNNERRIDATYTIFSMICIELWCRMFVDKTTPQVS